MSADTASACGLHLDASAGIRPGAANSVDDGQRIVWQFVASPGDMPIRPNQRQAALIKGFDGGIGDVVNVDRDPAPPGCIGQRRYVGRRLSEAKQDIVLPKQVPQRSAVREPGVWRSGARSARRRVAISVIFGER